MGGIRQRDRTHTPLRLQSASTSQAGSRDGTDLPTVRLLLVGSPVNEKDTTWGEFGWGRHLICWVFQQVRLSLRIFSCCSINKPNELGAQANTGLCIGDEMKNKT